MLNFHFGIKSVVLSTFPILGHLTLHFLFIDAQPIVLIWRNISHFLIILGGP